jgi:hypothetical protein
MARWLQSLVKDIEVRAAAVTSPNSTVGVLPHQVRRSFPALFTGFFVLLRSGDAVSCCHSSNHATLESYPPNIYILLSRRGVTTKSTTPFFFLDDYLTSKIKLRKRYLLLLYFRATALRSVSGVYPHALFFLRGLRITFKISNINSVTLPRVVPEI